MQRAYVIGSPIAHSLSPAIHNAAFAALGIDARYEAVEVAPPELGAWVARARQEDLLGFNVTLPHKEAIVHFLDDVEGDAKCTRAVNMVRAVESPSPQPSPARGEGVASHTPRGRRLIGANTDVAGFRRSLQEEADTSLRAQRVLLLGAGGAARAIALVALQDQANQLWVANRHPERAQRLLDDLGPVAAATRIEAMAIDGSGVQEILRQATVIVNATSVGLRSEETPLNLASIEPGTLVVDAVYNPPETAFLLSARARGVRTLGGLGMLVYQAAEAFESWTHQPAPVGVMREAAERALAVGD